MFSFLKNYQSKEMPPFALLPQGKQDLNRQFPLTIVKNPTHVSKLWPMLEIKSFEQMAK